MLYGMIDIGSNTVRMAIYRIEGTHVEMLMKKKHTVGLAAYLKDGVMQKQGIDKAVEILKEFRAFLLAFGITHVVAFTTAALRNAKNSAAAVGEIERRTGLPIPPRATRSCRRPLKSFWRRDRLPFPCCSAV